MGDRQILEIHFIKRTKNNVSARDRTGDLPRVRRT